MQLHVELRRKAHRAQCAERSIQEDLARIDRRAQDAVEDVAHALASVQVACKAYQRQH